MNNAIGLEWINFKNLSVQREFPMMYYIDNSHYFIFIGGGQINFETRIRIESPPNPNQIDFQDNFKDDIDNNKTPTSTDLDLTSNFTVTLNVPTFNSGGSIQLFWDDLDAFNARAILQSSDDGVNWNDLGGQKGGIILMDSPDSQRWEIVNILSKFIKLDYTANSVTTGLGTLLTLFRI